MNTSFTAVKTKTPTAATAAANKNNYDLKEPKVLKNLKNGPTEKAAQTEKPGKQNKNNSGKHKCFTNENDMSDSLYCVPCQKFICAECFNTGKSDSGVHTHHEV